MNVNNKYFDVVIDSNSFYIIESSSKPKTHKSAIATLNKIETILKNRLAYDIDHQDDYSKLSKIDLSEILKNKSSEIHNGYKEKQSKLNWIVRKIFSQEKKINAIHTRIENYVTPPQVLPLPNELIEEVTKYLGISEQVTLAQLNRHGKAHAASAIVKRAQEFGYEGHDKTEAVEYVKELFNEVQNLSRQGMIPEKYLAYKKNKIDLERILQNLQGLHTEDIFNILGNEKLYSSSFQKFRKIFNPKWNWKVSKVDSNHVKEKGNVALFLAAKNENKNILELLLRHGANINARDQD
ncbi:hypothetical protein pah_c271o001, partial [Parachlamydia acanthamoebae str. Hall's coccus]